MPYQLLVQESGQPSCIPAQHIWISSDLPPLKYARCMCGRLTWEEGVTLVWEQATEREQRGEPTPANLPDYLDHPQGFF